MNWTTLLKFRKQVEDLARERVVLAEWEKSQELAKRQELSRDMEKIVIELEECIQAGVNALSVEEHYEWLDRLGTGMERHTQQINKIEETLSELREKLKKAHHARRVVEIVIAKKEAAVLKKIAEQEQRIQEDLSAHAFAASSHEEMT